MKDGRYLVGEVGVDSGQVLICDPCYIGKRWDKEYSDSLIAQYIADKKPRLNYSGCCAASQSSEQAGQLYFEGMYNGPGAGVASTSGFGDGSYQVYATLKTFPQWGQRVVKLEVIFEDPEDDEELEDELDDEDQEEDEGD